MHFLYGFLVVTFVIHAVAFTVLALKRRKFHYFFLSGTFIFLIVIYILKFNSLWPVVPGTDISVIFVLRILAIAHTLAYLITISRIEGTWLQRLFIKFSR